MKIRPPQIRSLAATLVTLFCAASLVTLPACGSVAKPAASASTPPDGLAPSELDVKATVEQVEPWVIRVPVDITFLSGGAGVQLGLGDTVQCNGVQLRADPSDRIFPHMYRGEVPRVLVGGVYEFVYTHKGVRGVIRAPVLPGPTIISPPAGAQLVRTPKVTITYVAGTSAGVSGEINQTRGSGGEFATWSSQPDNGTYSMPVPTRLQPGPGWIILYRAMAITPSGTGFRSVRIVDNASVSGVQVQWL